MADINALVTAIGNLVAAMQPGAAGPPAPNTSTSPYAGDAINLSSRNGLILYLDGCKPLPTPFTGKIEELYTFLSDLKQKAQQCHWYHNQHGILTIHRQADGGNPAVDLDLIDSYGQITLEELTTARTAREAANDARAKQNAVMMHETIYATLAGDAKTKFISTGDDTKDGTITFFKVVEATFTATFTHSQSMRVKLNELHPKTFKYDIVKVNEAVRFALKTLIQGSKGQGLTQQEALFYLFNAYKRIKSPPEWVNHILFLESQASRSPDYTAEQLMNDAEAKFNELSKNWKPNDRSNDEVILAMLANLKSGAQADTGGKKRGKGKGNKGGKGKKGDYKPPPFADEKGKEGDTKKHNGKTYYYCSGEHKDGHWVQHKPSECRSKGKNKSPGGDGRAKGNNAKKGKVEVDQDKIQTAAAALADMDTSNLSPDEVASTLMGVLAAENNQE